MTKDHRLDSAGPTPGSDRSSDWIASGLLLLAAGGLFRGHLLGHSLFLGNYDRLGYFLAARLSEFDALRTHGATSNWDDRMFMGFNSAALPGATSPLSPMRAVTALVSRPEFYYWAGACVVGLMALAGIAAYFCLRKLNLGPAAAWIGGLVYMCSTHSMIRLAQADTSSLLLAALPTGTWLIFSARTDNLRWHLAGIAGLATLLFYSATGPPTIYLMGFWSVLAVYQSRQTKTAAPLGVCVGGIIVGFVIALPHLLGVARELRGMVRDGGVGSSFEAVYSFFNVRPHEWLRALDEGIFGRSPGEVAALGNNLNLSEGFQVYSSTFATLAIAALLLRRRGEWFRLFMMKDGLMSFFAWALVLLCAAVLFKPMAEFTYWVFLKGKLIHARLSFIATLPAAILTALAVQEWLTQPPGQRSGRPVVTLAAALFAATLLWLGLQIIAGRSYAPAHLEWWRPVTEIIPAALHLLLTGTASLGPAPELPADVHPVWLLSSRVVTLLCAFSVFTLLAGLAWWRPRLRPLAGQVLLALIALQVLQEADQRWNGLENHSYPAPFTANNFFIAPAYCLRSDQPAAAAELHARLEPGRYRTVFLPEAGQFHHFVAPHLTSYWGLRTVEGYLSGVPERLAALAWPEGPLGFRTISFTSSGALPWELLGILNVRQAVVADTPLYFGVPRPGGADEASALRCIPNPASVLPREFFVPRTVPGQPFAARSRPISLNPDTARTAPEVEGLSVERHWSTEGSIQAAYRGDRVSIAVTVSDQPRFLVLNELYHPRWFARTGATALRVYPVNTVMRGVEIPAGVTTVEFEFRPYSRFAGWWLFPLSGCGVLLALFAFPRIGRNASTAVPWLRTLGMKFLSAAQSPGVWRWGLVGLLATGLNLGLLYLLVDRLRVPYLLAPALSAILSISARFLMNDRWVFGFARPTWRRWGEYYLATAGGFAAWWSCSALLTYAGLHYLFAACLAIGCSIGINAVSNFAWIWHPRRHPPGTGARWSPVVAQHPAPILRPNPAMGGLHSPRHNLRASSPRPAWVVVLATYVVLYAVLLFRTDGYPYVLDNNESYSSWWHARSLYENGIAKTKGLTDEVFSPAPTASPYIHSHQGNLPRLFTFILYAAGFRSISAQIWLTTFTVGLAAVWLAFRFLSRLANPLFATLTCLLLITDYLFFTQWQVGLYNIWHGFFFFSSLWCVQTLGTAERPGRWLLLATLNFAALFYWEYVFTAFIAVLCGLYALVLYWRRFRLVWLLAGALVAGAAIAAGTLLAQLTAYMGWSNVMEDVRLTLTARNAAADPALLERVTSFYREHRIIFWHNFTEAAPLRSFSALWDSLFAFHLKYYTPALLGSAAVLVAGWGLGCWQWAHRGGRRLLPALLLLSFTTWVWRWSREAGDPTLLAEFVITPGGAALLAAEPVFLFLIAALALACATTGNTRVLGHATARAAGVLPLLLCGLAAYTLTYRIFTGYIYSGYLHRFVPLPVFLTVLLLGLVLHLLAETLRPRARRLTSWLGLAGLLGFAGYWVILQATYARVAPADAYYFLPQLERAPFKGRSLVTNTYPAAMAARTGSWGYADTSIFSGTLQLTPRGFEVERNLNYLWLADRDTNPAYLKPDLAIFYAQTPNFSEALAHHQFLRALPANPPPIANAGLFRRARSKFQPFLQHQVLADDGRRHAIARLDWDYPPYLLPQEATIATLARQLTLRQALAVSADSMLLRRWRVELEILDGPLPPAAITLTADGKPVALSPAPGAGPQVLVLEADELRLQLQPLARACRVRLTVNESTENIDLGSLPASGADFSWSVANRHGSHTRVPQFPAGFHLLTELVPSGGRTFARLNYRYTHQDKSPEAASIVRLYAEDPAGRWRLADCITYLGTAGLPVRLDEFRRANPDTVAEHNRITAAGDPRTFEQWLADCLALSTADHHRHGVVTEVLPSAPPGAGITDDTVIRTLPLPEGLTGRLQFSITPATRTKAGPEYFGLPFTRSAVPETVLALPSAPPDGNPAASTLPFGRLSLKLRFPIGHWSQSEPLLTTGSNEAGDVVYVIYSDPGHIRIGFDHWFKGGPVSPPISIDYTRDHDLEISIGSLYPPADAIVFANRPAAEVARLKERVVITLNGQTVIDSAGSAFESNPLQVNLGGNAIRATTAGLRFTGEILSSERIWPWSEENPQTP